MLSLQIAKACFYGSDGALSSRTRGDAMRAITKSKFSSSKDRWIRAAEDAAFAPVLLMRIEATSRCVPG